MLCCLLALYFPFLILPTDLIPSTIVDVGLERGQGKHFICDNKGCYTVRYHACNMGTDKDTR